MVTAIIILVLGFWFIRNTKDDDSVYRAKYIFINNFIRLYENDTGIRLTYDQAVALLQVTQATMAKSPEDKVYLDERCQYARRVVEQVCEEAENKVLKKDI